MNPVKVFLLIMSFLVFSRVCPGQSADRKAVYNAAMDYIEAMYKSEPHRIERSVFKDVVKRGFYWKGLDSAYSDMKVMTFDQLVQVAKDYNKTGWIPSDSPKEVEIFDILDKTASARVIAYWGTDYLQLAKFGDKWLIVNILWQSKPKGSKAEN